MKYDSEKTWCIEYWDQRRDYNVDVHTDSLPRAVNRFLSLTKKSLPTERIDIVNGNVSFATWKPTVGITWHELLATKEWQQWIATKT